LFLKNRAPHGAAKYYYQNGVFFHKYYKPYYNYNYNYTIIIKPYRNKFKK